MISWLPYIQIAEVVVLALGFLFTIRRLKISLDARNVDFVIHAEGQVDPLFTTIIDAKPQIAKRVFPALLTDVKDEDVTAMLYIYYAYRHNSRIYYLLTNSSVTLGMTQLERKELLETWVSELEKYNFELLQKIHAYGSKTGEFNSRFVNACGEWIARKEASVK
jgi:hypothetical protein